MLFDILEHDQLGTGLYEAVRMPFSEEFWDEDQDACGEVLDRYIDDLTKNTLGSFTTTSYSWQKHGQICNAGCDTDEEAEAMSAIVDYMMRQDPNAVAEILYNECWSEEKVERVMDKL